MLVTSASLIKFVKYLPKKAYLSMNFALLPLGFYAIDTAVLGHSNAIIPSRSP